jgi:hypothetical protein
MIILVDACQYLQERQPQCVQYLLIALRLTCNPLARKGGLTNVSVRIGVYTIRDPLRNGET